ncbi:ABC transporter permease subunit [Candidatus Poriferisocius sp.]|uniref:ABC transporter permease subunit n=1 Tax=Candidatus Poriferisocius sp. TaxID=3101276 RepID=UPI003B530337
MSPATVSVLGTWITQQLAFDGVVNGLVTGLVAMGIVLIYRSTRVINFAVGNMGIIAASMMALLMLNYGWGFWLALVLSLALGVLFAAAVELTVIRRLFTSPRVIVLVATVGIAQLAQLVVSQLPDIEAAGKKYPVPVGSIWEDVWFTEIRVRGPQLTILIAVPLLALLLGWLMNRTAFGKSVAASANNRDLSRLSGINPKIVSTFVWVMAGLLASVSMIMLSGSSGQVAGLANLGPQTLGKAMVAAVLAAMVSFPRAMLAGVLIGVLDALFRFNFFTETGLIDFVIFLAVLVAVYFQSRSQGETGVFSFTPKVRPIPERLRQVWWLRHLSRIALVALLVLGAILVQLPGISNLPSRQLLYATVLCFAVCGLSVTIITGWAGQLSLAQMTFAGMGALFAAGLKRGLSMDFTVGTGFLPGDALSYDFFDIQFETSGIPFMAAIPLAALFSALVAAVIGIGSLRVRGLYLAVTTFVFALAAQQYLYRRPFFTGGSSSSVSFRRGELFGLELKSQKAYYYVCLAFLLIVVIIVSRLRRSGVGRSIIAVRDNADSASGYTVGPVRSKLSAFALAGGIAGLGGALLAGLVQNVPISERFFQVGDSLQLIGMVVIGGLGSSVGAVLGAIWVYGLPNLFDSAETVALFSSSIGLLLVLMYFPGGLVQIGYSARNALIGIAERRLGPDPGGKTIQAAPTSLVRPHDPRPATDPIFAGHNINVRFGGVEAVARATVLVHPDEIVGLIGTNGAGKSTFMNAVGGYVPSTGQVELLGSDITRLSAPRRARAGLGRTFQTAALFPELSVRETVQVALEARRRTPIISTALHLPHTFFLERRRRSEAEELIDYLGLGRYADSYISDLSTGTRRIVEITGLLALGARVLCLDEPTAGVAQRETEAFGPLIVNIRRELGAAMLIIEHDMPLIMSISDRVYCLEAGKVIAEGSPSAVRNDPLVIASYLGTDERAIAISDG